MLRYGMFRGVRSSQMSTISGTFLPWKTLVKLLFNNGFKKLPETSFELSELMSYYQMHERRKLYFDCIWSFLTSVRLNNHILWFLDHELRWTCRNGQQDKPIWRLKSSNRTWIKIELQIFDKLRKLRLRKTETCLKLSWIGIIPPSIRDKASR